MLVFTSFSDSFIDNALPIRYLCTYNDYIDYFVLQRTKWLLRPAKFCIMFYKRWFIFFGLQLLNWCQKINKMYNMMILQKLVVKQGRVAVNVYNKHFDFKFPYDVHCWLEKYVVRAFCLSVLVFFSPIFHYSGSWYIF